VYVHLLHNRLRLYLCDQLLPEQYGFCPDRGTPGALFSLRRLTEIHRAHGQPLVAGFVDLTKAFDSVPRPVLWRLLLARGVPSKLVSLIQDLYDGSEFKVTVAGAESAWQPMTTGVRQGCPLSPTLFNTFMDFLARQITHECHLEGLQGITVRFGLDGSLVPPPSISSTHPLHQLLLLYADDVAALASSLADMQRILLIIERVCHRWGMQLSHKKTEVVVLVPPPPVTPAAPPCPPAPASLQLAGGSVKIVQQFKYLGSIQQPMGSLDLELSRRLSLARHAFKQLSKRYLCCSSAPLKQRMDVYKAVVVPTLTYGAAEAWAPTQAQLQQLDCFNTSCLRRMLNLSTLDHVSNEELYRLTDQQSISSLIRMHRLRWLGHLARQAPHTPAHQLLFAHGLPAHHRVRSGVHQTWSQIAWADVQDAAKRARAVGLSFSPNSWYSTAQSRAGWAILSNMPVTE
jgi:hypothetical protein